MDYLHVTCPSCGHCNDVLPSRMNVTDGKLTTRDATCHECRKPYSYTFVVERGKYTKTAIKGFKQMRLF